ncbi:MAG: nucleotidyl transferase AbiEii/AbiGii toxin family protein [Firmicutes bacterium]|nr:nucleotidyl transferase AbiEii/AbiGii toxin family protein [Bacillota bacterium]
MNVNKKENLMFLAFKMTKICSELVFRGSFALSVYVDDFDREVDDLDVSLLHNDSLKNKHMNLIELMKKSEINIVDDKYSILTTGYYEYSKIDLTVDTIKVDGMILEYTDKKIHKQELSFITGSGDSFCFKINLYPIELLLLEKYLSLSRFFYMEHKFNDERWLKALYDIGIISKKYKLENLIMIDDFEDNIVKVYLEQYEVHKFFDDDICFSRVFRSKEFFINLNDIMLEANYYNFLKANRINKYADFDFVKQIIKKFTEYIYKNHRIIQIENSYNSTQNI